MKLENYKKEEIELSCFSSLEMLKIVFLMILIRMRIWKLILQKDTEKLHCFWQKTPVNNPKNMLTTCILLSHTITNTGEIFLFIHSDKR